MNEFIAVISTFPTIIFAVPVALACLYWLFVIIGAVDIDLIDSISGLDGLLDGAGEGAAEAAAEAAGEAVAEAAAEAGIEAAAEAGAEAGSSLLLGLLSALQIGRVPVTFTLSFWVLTSFAMAYTGAWFAPRFGVSPESLLPGLLISVVAFFVGGIVASIAVRPLGDVFETKEASKRVDFIGHQCTIRTGRIDARFGQAECADGGAGLLIDVRCDVQNALKKGDRALIVSFDDAREAYIIEPTAGL
jgi:hypothetical protein